MGDIIMYCSKCGEKQAEDAIFCNKCGEGLNVKAKKNNKPSPNVQVFRPVVYAPGRKFLLVGGILAVVFGLGAFVLGIVSIFIYSAFVTVCWFLIAPLSITAGIIGIVNCSNCGHQSIKAVTGLATAVILIWVVLLFMHDDDRMSFTCGSTNFYSWFNMLAELPIIAANGLLIHGAAKNKG
jgi:ribosomal protein L40E